MTTRVTQEGKKKDWAPSHDASPMFNPPSLVSANRRSLSQQNSHQALHLRQVQNASGVIVIVSLELGVCSSQ